MAGSTPTCGVVRGFDGGTTISTVEALDRAFAGEVCHVVRSDGTSEVLAVEQWRRAPTQSDDALFISGCTGATLDVGCGPGRLVAELARRGVEALGIDISPEAVRQARSRGATALCHNVFDALVGGPRWSHVLLADGNVGMSGDPWRLLTRTAQLLSPAGCVVVELASAGATPGHSHLRLRLSDSLTRPFCWSTVGAREIVPLARAAGLRVASVQHDSGRLVARLVLAHHG